MSVPPEFLDGREPSEPDLEAIRLQLEAFDHIDAVSDEMRGIIERHWPHLLGKLPPPIESGK
jgi:hypothetical protein